MKGRSRKQGRADSEFRAGEQVNGWIGDTSRESELVPTLEGVLVGRPLAKPKHLINSQKIETSAGSRS